MYLLPIDKPLRERKLYVARIAPSPTQITTFAMLSVAKAAKTFNGNKTIPNMILNIMTVKLYNLISLLIGKILSTK